MGGKSRRIQPLISGQDLKDAFEKLEGPEEPPKAHTWPRYLWDIRRHVREGDPNDFLTWSTLHATMFVGSGAYFVADELKALEADDWDRWKLAIEEPWIGKPEPMPGPYQFTTGNMIHQAYHLLQFEQMAGVQVQDLDRIVEFGGGYGALAWIVRGLGFLGEYLIYDNPEMSLIQQFYLSQADIDADYSVTNGRTFDPPGQADLLFAAYSISEVPEELRLAFLGDTDFNHYFFVHQNIYQEIMLKPVFDEFAKSRPDKEWTDRKSPVHRHRYLLGKPIE